MLLEKHNRKFASLIINQLIKFRAIRSADYLCIIVKDGHGVEISEKEKGGPRFAGTAFSF
jgi:hypothetical protein